MQGCVQRVFFGDVNAATVRVLAAEGWEVARAARSRAAAARCSCTPASRSRGASSSRGETIAAYEGFDVVAVNVAGCGSAMKDYGHLLADDPEWAERAAAFSAKVRDVHELLADARAAGAARTRCRCASPTTTPATSPTPRASARSRASCCAASPGSSCSSPPSGSCAAARPASTTCSSPRPRRSSASARPRNLLATGAEAIAAANPGCALQIAAHASVASSRLPPDDPARLSIERSDDR